MRLLHYATRPGNCNPQQQFVRARPILAIVCGIRWQPFVEALSIAMKEASSFEEKAPLDNDSSKNLNELKIKLGRGFTIQIASNGIQNGNLRLLSETHWSSMLESIFSISSVHYPMQNIHQKKAALKRIREELKYKRIFWLTF